MTTSRTPQLHVPNASGNSPPTPPDTDGSHDSRETRRQLSVAFHSAPVGMAVTTDSGELVRVNDALGDLLGVPAGVLLGRRLEDLAIPQAVPVISAGRSTMIARGHLRHTTNSTLRRANGTPVPVCLTCARVPPTATAPGYLVVHVQDTSERLATEAELTRRALHDPLTGLPNRALLLDRLDQALARLTRQPSTLAVLFADLDGFKHVNDTWGHAVGDQVLIAVARRLQQLQRPADTACRLGGDEFVVLCQDSSRSQADSVAARIRAALTSPISLATRSRPDGGTAAPIELVLTASLGVATTSEATTTPEQLLAAADAAMYRSKRA